MNIRMTVHILGWVTCFEGLFLLPSCLVALVYQESEGMVYLALAALYLALGYAIAAGRKRPASGQFYARDGFVCVALTWILISVLGALPFIFTGDIPDPIDAIFETASGFTTTGATILSDVEALSKSSLFWRSFTHWLGGMGILVFMMAILPLSSGRNIHLMRAESPGPSVEKMVPKVRQSAALLYAIYTVLTLAELLLLLAGGMPFFEAITTSFSTAGTGGFAVLNSNMSGYSPYLQYVVTIFMLLFGINFNVYYLLLLHKFRTALLYEEMRWYLIVISAATALIMWDIRNLFPTLEEVFRHSAFQVVSIITTTGFMSVDFDLWPKLSHTVLILLMFIGACAGSTGGGIKVSRWIILFKYLRTELRRLMHPRMISRFRLNGAVVGEEIIRSMLLYLVAYFLTFVLSLMVVSLEGYDLVTNFSALATCYNNVGPGLNLVGPTLNFSFYSSLSKLVFTADMLLGRLEVIPLLVLVSAASGSIRRRLPGRGGRNRTAD